MTAYAQFHDGPLAGQTLVRDHDWLRQEVTVDGHVYGVLDVYDDAETLIVTYAYIERVA